MKRPDYISSFRAPYKRNIEKDLESILKEKSLKLNRNFLYPDEKNDELFFDYYVKGKEKTYLIEVLNMSFLSGMGSFRLSTNIDFLAKTVKDKTKYILILMLRNANKDDADKIKTQLHKDWDYVIPDKGLKELKQIIQ